ncbi:hypothetical protein Tco_1447459 [Tanacetum coccineum]
MTTPSPSPPISLSPPSAGERLARCTAPPAHSPPLPPSSGCLTQIQTLRIASTQALIDAVTAALPPPSLPPLPPSLSIPITYTATAAEYSHIRTQQPGNTRLAFHMQQTGLAALRELISVARTKMVEDSSPSLTEYEARDERQTGRVIVSNEAEQRG